MKKIKEKIRVWIEFDPNITKRSKKDTLVAIDFQFITAKEDFIKELERLKYL